MTFRTLFPTRNSLKYFLPHITLIGFRKFINHYSLQFFPFHVPLARQWKIINKMHPSSQFHMISHTCCHIVCNRLSRHYTVNISHDNCRGQLYTLVFQRQPNHANLLHSFHLGNYLLQGCRLHMINVLEKVTLSIAKMQKSIFVKEARISRPEPTVVVERRFGCFLIFEVSLK